jgi:exodeoxyribonuclease VII large subunit
MSDRKVLTLYELNSLVQAMVERSMPMTFWVEAEVSEAREVRGHCFMDLIQKDPFSATPVARASAKCWKSTWMRLQPRFERVTGQSLHAGMNVLLCVKADFHPAYGFSWIVVDMDPTFTLGDMARKRMEIVRQLKEEGVFDLQRELSLSAFAQHVAVISSEQAAGYGDFCDQLLHNDEGLFFHIELFPATMQGEQVESSIIHSLNQINERLDDFDVVVIIRGGGATSDLSGFDTLSLAENVANFPLPIITGIGHERDESVLDMVSFRRVKTPTAAAAFLIDHLAATANHIEELREAIADNVRTRLDAERSRLQMCMEKLPMLFSLVKAHEDSRLERWLTRLVNLSAQRLADQRHRLETLQQQLALTAQQETAEARRRLEQLSAQVPLYAHQTVVASQHRLSELRLRTASLDPDLLLRRGYSITTLNGRVLRDASQLSAGDEIVTRLHQGTVRSRVVDKT